ncbi:MAG: LON peptidase substrate-binding domain-containing protein, partial [Proteobacteria bacterium]|nr:LON peptidase substrate-binding domain-containing protein [Pseudomonadota bacterium]
MFGFSSHPESPSFNVLPLRDIVVFPHMIVPLFVGRDKSVRALEHVMEQNDKKILLVTQKNASQDDPNINDLYTVGTVGSILQLLKLPDGSIKILVEGTKRARILKMEEEDGYFTASIEEILPQEKGIDEAHLDALMRSLNSQFEQYVKLNRKIPPDILVTVNQIDDPVRLADTIASYLTLKISDKQEILETVSLLQRLEKMLVFIEGEIGVMQVEKRIRSRVKRQMEKTQKEYYLNEQLKAIQKELG